MKLQTERIQSELGKAVLHHGQRRHLLCDKQHGFPMIQRICNHVGDGLGFAGTGRAVQDKALPPGCRIDRRKLRGIRTCRNCHIRGFDLGIELGRVEVFRMRLPFESTGQERCHDLILPQLLASHADIVPHDELAERELPQHTQRLDRPVRMQCHRLTDGVIDLRKVCPVLILRHGVKPVNADAVILPQEFKEGDIDLGVLVTDAQRIGLPGDAPHKIDRQQHQRGIPGLCGTLVLKPFEEADSQIQRIRTVFLQADLGGTVELLERLRKVGLMGTPKQLVGFQGFCCRKLCGLGILGVVEFLIIDREDGLLRHGAKPQIHALCKLILQHTQIIGKALQTCRTRSVIEQRIAQGKIEQLALPELLLGHRALYRGGGKVGIRFHRVHSFWGKISGYQL